MIESGISQVERRSFGQHLLEIGTLAGADLGCDCDASVHGEIIDAIGAAGIGIAAPARCGQLPRRGDRHASSQAEEPRDEQESSQPYCHRASSSRSSGQPQQDGGGAHHGT